MSQHYSRYFNTVPGQYWLDHPSLVNVTILKVDRQGLDLVNGHSSPFPDEFFYNPGVGRVYVNSDLPFMGVPPPPPSSTDVLIPEKLLVIWKT